MVDRRLVFVLVGLAVFARAAAVLVLQSHLVPRSTYEHGEIAANLLAGKGFRVWFLGAEGPTSQQAPVYPCLVAAAYAVGGVATPRALLILELGQALLGGWLVFEVIRLARLVVPDRPIVPIVAGLIAAVHPTLVYAATHVQVASLAAALVASVLAQAFGARSVRGAIGVGVALAALILTDPILGLVAPGAIWAIARARSGWRQAATSIAAMALTAVLGIAPWIVRNAMVHGELVLVKSTFGYAFWQGNCRLSKGTDKVVRESVERALDRPTTTLGEWNNSLWAARHEAGYLDDIALTAADYRTLAAVSEPERSRILARRAFDDIRADPARYMALCLRRIRYFVLFDETNPKTRNVVYRASHLGLTLLALAGWIAAPAVVRRRLAPLALTVALIAGFHALTIVSARFHIPIEPLLAVFAASGLARRSVALEPAAELEGLGVAGRLGRGRGLVGHVD